MPVVLEPSWVGRRVSVRRAVGRGADGRVQFADVVGDLLRLDATTALVEHRGGLVEVPLEHVAVARLAPPSTADELALEAVAARGWRAAETAELGGWLLRANGGFTSRANSVLPLRAPGLPLEAAIAQARAWYAERGLPLRFAVPAESRRLLDAELGERGWIPSGDVMTMTARLDQLPTEGSAAAVLGEPDDAWLAVYREGAAASEEARALLTRHDRAGFAVLRDGGQTVAIGRGCVDDEWLGVTAVEVVESHRRRGLATQIMRALWRWGAEQGATRSYLQVWAGNTAAMTLYERLGYREHHVYRYRVEPQPAAT
jgi:GNAT superfamily N-acetyltransferase